MKLYILATDDSKMYHFFEKVYIDKRMAELQANDLNNCGYDYEVKEIELPFVGKYVCYVHAYYGYTYGYCDIHDVEAYSDVYPCVNNARESPLWAELMERVHAEGEDKHVFGTDHLNRHFVATKYYGEGFFYGDYCLGCFRATICHIKVVRQTYEQYTSELNRFLKECGY